MHMLLLACASPQGYTMIWEIYIHAEKVLFKTLASNIHHATLAPSQVSCTCHSRLQKVLHAQVFGFLALQACLGSTSSLLFLGAHR